MRARCVVLSVLFAALPLAGCGGCVTPPVAPPDGGPTDAGFDAGPDDADFDAGFDAGPDDAGFDTGPDDAGFDAGTDAGLDDAGHDDVGFDAGPDDAGFDAGTDDAGFDAGLPPDPVCIGGNDTEEEEPVPDVLITTLADVVDDSDGVLSLREALAQLEDGTIPPGSVIGFDRSLSGTVALSGAIGFSTPVTLVGHDANGDHEPDIWLERHTTDWILNVPIHTTGEWRFRWLGFTGARYPLRVTTRADASLTVERCAFTDQRLDGGADGAIWFHDVVSDDSPFPDPLKMRLVVRHTTFRDVDVGVSFYGAAHTDERSVLVESSVFDIVRSSAIAVSWATQVTIANTVAYGAPSLAGVSLYQVPDARLVNTTVATSNAAPRLRHRDSNVHLYNTVLTGPGADCGISISSSEVTAFSSFIGVAEGCTFVGENNLLGTTENPLDPLLLPLGDHGGERPSAPPAPGSPLIDRGEDVHAVLRDGSALGHDVRGLGFPRLCDGDDDGVYTVDIGATEFKPEE